MLLLGVSGGAFSPLSIGGLAAWWDASYGPSLYKERTSPTTLASADGDPVGTWFSRVGGHSVYAPSDPLISSLKLNALGSMPAVNHNSTYFESAFTIPDRMTILIAYSSRTAGSLYGAPLLRTTQTWPNVASAELTHSSYNTKRLLTHKWNYVDDVYSMRLNGVDEANSTVARDNPITFYIGQAFGEFLAGYLHEILVYNSILNSANTDLVESYLQLKWALY